LEAEWSAGSSGEAGREAHHVVLQDETTRDCAAFGQICAVGSNPCQPVSSTTAPQVDYLAPGSIPLPNPISVTATSAADSTKFSTANISVVAPLIVGITLSPGSTTVNSGSTAQFQASVTNTSNTTVNWTASAGTVSSSGLYTAPAVKANSTAVITATSSADSTKSATANISLIAPPAAKVALEVLYPPTNPHTQDYQSVQTYLMNNPAVTGANLAIEWGVIDQGPTANPQYNWSAVDALIVPWATAGKKVKHGTNKAAGKIEEKTRDKQ